MSRLFAMWSSIRGDSHEIRAAAPGRWSPSAMALLLSLAAAGCGTSAATPSPSAAAADEPGTIVCGSFEEVDSKGRIVQRPEYYVTYSMNRKLQYYPDFAAEIGMQSVHGCDEARTFSQAYAKYFAAHPYFDMDLPIDPSAHTPSPKPIPAGETIEKVLNGTTSGLSFSGDPFPVVKISHLFHPTDTFFNQDGSVGNPVSPDGNPISAVCSGTFIAKNWILTAAHCFEKVVLTFPPGGQERSQWITEDVWYVSWPDAFGNTTDAADPMGPEAGHFRGEAVTYAHPSFSNVTHPFDPKSFNDQNPAASIPYDIGLLYIQEAENDWQLAPNADNSAWDIQTGHPTQAHINSWSLNLWGYGRTQEDGTNDGRLNAFLGGPPPSGITTSAMPPDSPTAGSQYQTNIVNPALEWAICSGDSGGPLVRQVQTGGGKVDNVIIGVNSSFKVPQDSSGLHCGSAQGRASLWAAVDVASQFIIDTINGSQIVGMRNLGSGQDAYTKMHGKACQSDCSCGAGEVCLNPANAPTSPASRPLAGCQFCNASGALTCGCIMGQCVRSDGFPSDGGGPQRDCAAP